MGGAGPPAGVGHVIRQGPALHLLHRLPRRPDQIGGGQVGDIAELVEEIGAEQGAADLLEQQAGVPAMGEVGRMAKSSTLTSLPTRVQTGWVRGASSSQWLRPPISSDSKWLQAM